MSEILNEQRVIDIATKILDNVDRDSFIVEEFVAALHILIKQLDPNGAVVVVGKIDA